MWTYAAKWLIECEKCGRTMTTRTLQQKHVCKPPRPSVVTCEKCGRTVTARTLKYKHTCRLPGRPKLTIEQLMANRITKRLAKVRARVEQLSAALASLAGPDTACQSRPAPRCPAETPPVSLSPSERGDPA